MASSDNSLWIGELDPALPAGSEKLSDGDDSIRHFKKVVNDTLPQLTGAVNFTDTKLNNVDLHSFADTNQLILGINAKTDNVTNAAITITGAEINCNGKKLTNVNSVVDSDLDVPNKGYNDARYYTQEQVDSVINSLYPVGTIYENSVTGVNPATLLGFGTWVLFGVGRQTVCVDTNDADFNTPSEIGGTKTPNLAVSGTTGGHAITAAETVHVEQFETEYVAYQPYIGVVTVPTSGGWSGWTQTTNDNGSGSDCRLRMHIKAGSTAHTHPQSGTASGNAMNPYVTVYRWARTA